MAFSVATISPSVVDTCGGNIVTLTGSFVQGGAYTVSCVNTGSTSAATACYSGVAGSGASCVSPDGLTVQFASPMADPGLITVVVTEVSTGTYASVFGVDGLLAMPPFLSSMTYTLRSTLPLSYNTGPRSIPSIPVPSATAAVSV